ncbi:hypothetical protein [Methanobrevibacter sp.]|uniref:hypothetical protein n=1 Tax=Methanobrevibacter sp. TaxID=66852 RepID=UPI00386570D2
MNKRIILLLLLLGLLSLTVVNAATVTINVEAKHIEGNNQYPLFLLSTTTGNGYYKEIASDYMVHAEDYYNVNVGDTVTLDIKDNGYCEIVNKNSETDKWWFK